MRRKGWSSKSWERPSNDIVGPKPMTRSKLSSFTPTGHTVRLIGIPKLLPPKWSCDLQNYALQRPKGNGQNERYKGIVWKAVQCLLHTINRPLSDWECVLLSTLSSIWTLINTVTKESPSKPLIRPSSSAHWLRAYTPAYLRKFVRAKHQAPVVPVQISEVISPHFARVSFGDGRVDTVSTSDLSGWPPDVDYEETISQPGGQYNDKETNVDIGPSVPDIGTEC